MSTSKEVVFGHGSPEALSARYQRIRSATLYLCRSLKPEDFVVQSMPDVSPTKWHLAHVTWFFEYFVLQPYLLNYKAYNEEFDYLFNSYYYTVGPMHPRPKRGLLSRPTLKTVTQYREHVDSAMLELLTKVSGDDALEKIVVIGLNHEQQHQELLLTDIKHVFSCNPMKPAVDPTAPSPPKQSPVDHEFVDGVTGLQEIGAAGDEFCFDNETPRHRTFIHDHQMGSRLVTNGEYLEFIKDKGYVTPDFWLSDGWATINERQWNRPLYWNEEMNAEFTIAGEREMDLNTPVSHVSYYEADAYARWAEARLPTEAEWEASASQQPITGNFAESGFWHPGAADQGEQQFFGDVWEWTASAYSAYPGFKPSPGALGEYNGKFMCNQQTVRGGSCVSSAEHIRSTYRSFFYPDARWQFLGIRLARDV